MAANIFTGATDSNWGTATNWSLGTVPTATDGHVATFDATSPDCTINSTTRICNAIDFTGYVNTLNPLFNLQVNGDCTLSATMTILTTGASLQFVNASCSITSNGKVWPNNFGTSTPASGVGTVVVTLLDDWVITGSISIASSLAGGHTLNGFSLTFGGSLSVFGNGSRALGGTTQLIANGTGNFTTGVNSWIGNPLEINTSGTITFVTRFYKRSALFKYTSGTTQTNNCTFVFGSIGCTIDVNGDTNPSATTLSTTGINFWRLDTTGNVTHNVLSPIRIIDNHTVGGGNFNSSASIYNKGNLNVSSNSGSGLYDYYLDGTGTWSGGAIMRCNIIINTSGTITFSGNIRVGGVNNATFLYTAGTTITAFSTLQIGSSGTTTNLDLDGINWNTTSFFGTATTNLLSKLKSDNINFTVTHTLGGVAGFETNNLSLTAADNITVTLINGIRYLVKQSLVTNTSGYTRLFTCASGAALLDLQYGATQNLANTSATRINSLGGQTIYTTGTLTSTQNWNTGTYRNPNNFMVMF